MRSIFLSVLVLGFIFSGCSSGKEAGDKRVVAQVNDYKMKVEDLKYNLNNIPHDEKELLGTKEGMLNYVDRLLTKQILLQEAQRLGLDRERDFMKSIENYWEQALLRLLLQRKSKEIARLIHVYDKEVEEYYSQSGETQPLSKVKEDMIKSIRQKKETEAMSTWIDELRQRSYIKVNQDVLGDMFSK